MAEEDILWGKNRHFFGGIEPGNMQVFTSRLDETQNRIYLNCVLPDNTVIDNQVVCTVAGAVIRRKTNGYPKNEFDGDLIADITESAHLSDYMPSYNKNYYYKAFPYTTQGVYNRNDDNRTAVYNVLEPRSTNHITVGGSARYVEWDYPNLKFYRIDNGAVFTLTLSSKNEDIYGYTMRRSTTGYPVDENDGEEVCSDSDLEDLNNTGIEVYDYDVPINSTDTTEITYFYTVFPYNSSGVYLYHDSYKTKVTFPTASVWHYGFDIDLNDPNPDTRVTYPDDVDNTAFTPAKMDFANDVFNYGDWPSNPGTGFMPTPVMLNYDGTVEEILDHRDYSRKIDAIVDGEFYYSDSSVSAFYKNTNGVNYDTEMNAMMQWPLIYIYRYQDRNVYKFRCSNVKINDDYECWCNYDRYNRQVDYFYTAIYEGCSAYYATPSNSSKVYRTRSISCITVEATILPQNALSYASNINERWQLRTLVDTLLIQDLLVLMGKSTNCQKVYGKGVSVSYNTVAKTGTMDQKGLFWGSEDPECGVKVFGMEHWWGNHQHLTAGFVLENGACYAKFTPGTKDGTACTEYNDDGGGYMHVGGQVLSDGFMKEMELYLCGRLPSATGGSSTTYETDFVYHKSYGTNTVYMAGFGCICGSDVACGPFSLIFDIAMNTTSDSRSYRSAEVAYK